MKEKATVSSKLFTLLDSMPEFCNGFFIGRKNERVLNTRLGYARDLYVFFEFLHNTHPYFCEMDTRSIQPADMAQVRAEDLDKFIEIYSEKHSVKTVARMKSSISALYSYLVNTLQVVQFNPALGAQKIKIPEKDFVTYLTPYEQNLLIQTVKFGTGLSDREKKWHGRYIKRDLAMIFLFLDTGLRVSELQGIDNRDFDLVDCSVIVQRKGGSINKVYFSDEAAEYIRDYLEEKKALFPLFSSESDPFVITEKGERLSVRQIQNIVPKYVLAAIPEKAGTISPHKLRSSFAMTFYQRDPECGGHDLLTLQRRMNHKSITSTNVYAKAAENISRETRNWRESMSDD